MSRLRPPPPPELLDDVVVLDPDPLRPLELDPLDFPEEELVEYFVEVLDDSCVRTSVPKSVQSSHTSSCAPSTFTVFGEDVSAPHISHWTMEGPSPRPRINRTPGDTGQFGPPATCQDSARNAPTNRWSAVK
jgi:hypothetical protein